MISVRQVAKRVLPPKVVDWLRRRLGPRVNNASNARPEHVPPRKPGPTVAHILGLEVRLWSTGNEMYADRLARAVHLMPLGSRAHLRGSIALARWDFSQGRTDGAIQRLEGVQSSDPALQAELDLLRVDCLCDVGHGRTALTVLSRMAGKSTTEQNLLLRVGHARSLLGEQRVNGSGPMTEVLNSIYHGAGFGLVRRDSFSEPTSIANIACDVPPSEPEEQLPMVTVLTWLPDSSPEVYGGLSSLLNQSWTNLEILVLGHIDERDRLAVVDGAPVEDDRIVFIENASNDGHPWQLGIDHARGGLFTMHLPESWAHPQRVETQATALLADPSLLGTISSHMNVDSDLVPRPLGLTPRQELVGPDPHSTMIRLPGQGNSGVTARYEKVLAAYSPVTGDLIPTEGFALVNERVPLTLSVAVTRPSKAGSS